MIYSKSSPARLAVHMFWSLLLLLLMLLGAVAFADAVAFGKTQIEI